MMKILYKMSKVLLTAGLFFIYSCGEDPAPSLFELAGESTVPAVINSLSPPISALAGITPITITGENFSSKPGNNIVTFNGFKGKVISASTTQLTVIPPVVVSDSVAIKMTVTGSTTNPEFFSNIVIYKLTPAVAELFKFDPPALTGLPNGITCDNQENIYVQITLPSTNTSLGIKRINPQGSLTSFAPKGTEPSFFTSLTYGANNTIYATRRARGIIQATEGTTPSTFVSSGITQVVIDTDFDQNQNMWAGCDSNIVYRIKLTKEIKAFSFSGRTRAVKVFENSLFVAARSNSKEVIYKFPIISADSLGTPELYFNFSNTVDPLLEIKDITLSLDGDLYIGTNKKTDPIFIVHPNKKFETLYTGLIVGAIYSFVWGTDVFLYAATRNVDTDNGITILKIDLEKPGAPYLGRQ